MDRIYSADQIVIPPQLIEILKPYAKEVIRYQPNDIIAFSRDYFASLADGTLDAFLDEFEQEKLNNLEKMDNINDNNNIYDTYNDEGFEEDDELSEQEDYIAASNDAELMNLITSDDFISFNAEIFNANTNDNDTMNKEELSNAINDLSAKLEIDSTPTESDINNFFQVFDTDHNGVLDEKEFLRFTQQLFLYVMSFDYMSQDEDMQNFIRNIFESADQDGGGPDGILVFTEVWDAVKLINEELPKALRVRCDDESVASYIETYGNGKEGLNLEEFIEMFSTLLQL